MQSQTRVPACLAIAGSDSGGGAGIQADLKAFARCGVHGMTAITALTAQSTVGVDAVLAVAPQMIVAQVESVVSDIGVDAVKIGMLADEPTIEAVVEALELVEEAPVVVDPVMVSESGANLLDPRAKAALIERILPLATVVTPNLPEARALTGLGESATQRQLGEAMLALGPGAAVITGGHSEDGSDMLVERRGRAADRGPALSRRRFARLGLHPLLGAGRLLGPRRGARRRGALGQARWPPRRSATASGRSGAGRARWTSSGSRGARSR